MFSPLLTFLSSRAFLFIWWIVVLLVIGPGECSQDRKRAQQALQNQANDSHHLKEHLMEQMGMDEATAIKYLNETSNEVQFFLMHDYDNNSKLDGLELFQGLSHHEHSRDEGQGHSSTFLEDELASFVDTILEDQDHNDDGYIDYPEFVTSLRHSPGHTGGT